MALVVAPRFGFQVFPKLLDWNTVDTVAKLIEFKTYTCGAHHVKGSRLLVIEEDSTFRLDFMERQNIVNEASVVPDVKTRTGNPEESPLHRCTKLPRLRFDL